MQKLELFENKTKKKDILQFIHYKYKLDKWEKEKCCKKGQNVSMV